MGAGALDAARRLAADIDPQVAAERCGIRWDGDAFVIPFLGSDVRVAYPALELAVSGSLPPHVTALLVYHLAISDGTMPQGRWISFADLPDASFYASAFRGYTSGPLLRRFAEDRAALEPALAALGAQPLPSLADAAWCVPALPRVPIALLWWDADEEFGARTELLFDATACCHLPTDGCAVLGSWLVAMLARNAGGGR